VGIAPYSPRKTLLAVLSCLLGMSIGFLTAPDIDPGVVSRGDSIGMAQLCSAVWALGIYGLLSVVLDLLSKHPRRKTRSIGSQVFLTALVVPLAMLLTMNSCGGPRPSAAYYACVYRMKNIAPAFERYRAEHALSAGLRH
jgi:hypothetical protein